MSWSEFSFILQPSSLGGVGVFAVHDIAAGTPVFDADFEPVVRHIKDVPSDFVKYCVFLNEHELICPQRFDRMELGWFINHSAQPNIARATQLETSALFSDDPLQRRLAKALVAIKEIKSGDEIVMDYNSLNEPHHLKENYYR